MQERMRLPKAKFELLDCFKRPIMCVVTDNNGEAIIENLPLGTYFLRETEAPMGYEKNCDLVQIVIDEQNSFGCVEFVNRKKKGAIKIIKLGLNC